MQHNFHTGKHITSQCIVLYSLCGPEWEEFHSQISTQRIRIFAVVIQWLHDYIFDRVRVGSGAFGMGCGGVGA